MKLSLRHKVIAANMLVLILTFMVISLVVVEGINAINNRMLVQNLVHQADISVISIRQKLFTGTNPSDKEGEFRARSRDFAVNLNEDTSLRVLIFSKDGKQLADSGGESGENSEIADVSELSEAFRGNRAYSYKSYMGSRYIFFAFPVMQNNTAIGAVMFMQPLAETDLQVKNIRYLLLASFIGGLIVIFAVSLILSARITGPLLGLKDAAKEIAAGRFGKRIETKASDEVGELAAAFNTMSSEIEHRIAIISEEQRKLNSIIESMGEGVLAVDSRSEILAINKKAQSIMSSHLKEELKRISLKVLETGSRQVVEINTGESSLLVCATPLRLAGNSTGIVLVLNDITELRLLQEKQRQFVTNVSHELKTPLTTIIGYVDLLDEKGSDSEIFNDSVHYLKDASDRLLRLVTDLIDLSSLTKLEFEVEPRSTDISSLLRDITGQMYLKAQKFNITMNTDIPGVREIMADPIRIKQAVINILDNAIKYSSCGSITVSLKDAGDQVMIEVADTGCGIPAQVLDKIFEPFYRVDKARSRNLGGNGLGLAITKEIIEKHGGSIEINSVEGKGTRVIITLPRQQN